MTIFSAPSFYGAADRAIYDAGNYFIPQEQYRGAFTMQTPPATGTGGAAAATGINTVLNQGGGGGGNNPFNPNMDQIRTDFNPIIYAYTETSSKYKNLIKIGIISQECLIRKL